MRAPEIIVPLSVQILLVGSFLTERRKMRARLAESDPKEVVWITRTYSMPERRFARGLVSGSHSIAVGVAALYFIFECAKRFPVGATMAAGAVQAAVAGLLMRWFWKRAA